MTVKIEDREPNCYTTGGNTTAMKSSEALAETKCGRRGCDKPSAGAVFLPPDAYEPDDCNFTGTNWEWFPACQEHLEQEEKQHGTAVMRAPASRSSNWL
jgi:hypothetical protein